MAVFVRDPLVAETVRLWAPGARPVGAETAMFAGTAEVPVTETEPPVQVLLKSTLHVTTTVPSKLPKGCKATSALIVPPAGTQSVVALGTCNLNPVMFRVNPTVVMAALWNCWRRVPFHSRNGERTVKMSHMLLRGPKT